MAASVANMRGGRGRTVADPMVFTYIETDVTWRPKYVRCSAQGSFTC